MRFRFTRTGISSRGVEAARKRYLTLAKRLHPDKADHPQAAQAFAAVESAWQRLQ